MTPKMLTLTIENTTVTFEKIQENIDAIGQVIHPLALLEIDMRLENDWLKDIKHQLDTPNEHMKFDKRAVIVDTCIRNEFNRKRFMVTYRVILYHTDYMNFGKENLERVNISQSLLTK